MTEIFIQDDAVLYTQNQKVIHNEHIFSKYQKNIGELAYASIARISEREIDSNSLTF